MYRRQNKRGDISEKLCLFVLPVNWHIYLNGRGVSEPLFSQLQCQRKGLSETWHEQICFIKISNNWKTQSVLLLLLEDVHEKRQYYDE